MTAAAAERRCASLLETHKVLGELFKKELAMLEATDETAALTLSA